MDDKMCSIRTVNGANKDDKMGSSCGLNLSMKWISFVQSNGANMDDTMGSVRLVNGIEFEHENGADLYNLLRQLWMIKWVRFLVNEV